MLVALAASMEEEDLDTKVALAASVKEDLDTEVAVAAAVKEDLDTEVAIAAAVAEDLDAQDALAALRELKSMGAETVKEEHQEAKRTTGQPGSVSARGSKQYETDWPEHFRDEMTAQAASSSGSAKAQPTPSSPVTYAGIGQQQRVRVIPLSQHPGCARTR